MDDYDIYSLLGKKFHCLYCDTEHYIPTELVESKKGTIVMLPSLIERISNGRKVLLLADDITYTIAGQKIQAVFKDADWQVEEVILEPQDTKTVHAEEKYLPFILSTAKRQDILLTVGSGSITDMGKYVAHKLDIPVVSFPTAPSMNAYTSGVAVLMKNRLKVTSSVSPPKAVIIDTDIIFNSPLKLIQSGFADSMAKCYANADWQMSFILSGEYFCPLPLKIVTSSEKRYLPKGKKLLNRDEQVISGLMDGLLCGGFSMVIAGSSSPASGGEHLISHYLDMEACNRGREPFAYHGLQVGIGIILVAKIYERLGKIDLEEVKKRFIKRKKVNYRKEIENAFSDNSAIVWEAFKNKISILERLSTLLVQHWDEIKEKVFPIVRSQEAVKRFLQDAGCPIHFSEIGADRKLAYRTIMHARYIRDRLTILDIAGELNVLEEIAEDIRAFPVNYGE